jgi:hypothetical protein
MKRQPVLNYSQSNSKYDNRMQGLFYLPAPDIDKKAEPAMALPF